MTDVPVRDIRDPRALKALAHPVRLQILEELVAAGSATATELAERVGESPANCSWHLRQLARYGYVEEAGGGAGRQRPWRIVVQVNRWRGDEGDPDLTAAGDAAAEMLFAREFEFLRIWRATRQDEPPDWQQAAFIDQSLAWLTAEELAAVKEEMAAAVMRYVDRIGPGERPVGARLVRFVAWGVPAQ